MEKPQNYRLEFVETEWGLVDSDAQEAFLYLALIYQEQGKHDLAEDRHRQFLATKPDLRKNGSQGGLYVCNERYLERRPVEADKTAD